MGRTTDTGVVDPGGHSLAQLPMDRLLWEGPPPQIAGGRHEVRLSIDLACFSSLRSEDYHDATGVTGQRVPRPAKKGPRLKNRPQKAKAPDCSEPLLMIVRKRAYGRRGPGSPSRISRLGGAGGGCGVVFCGCGAGVVGSGLGITNLT